VLVVPAGVVLSKETSAKIAAFEKAGGKVVRCPEGVAAEGLWASVHSASA
jgi:hypothetical protein